MEKILIGLVVLLVAVGIVQAYEAVQLKNIVSEGVSVTPQASSVGTGGSSVASPPPNLQNLPDMVGGC